MVRAQMGQVGLGRDRVPGRNETKIQGSVSALETDGQCFEILSKTSDSEEGRGRQGDRRLWKGFRQDDRGGIGRGRKGGERRQV